MAQAFGRLEPLGDSPDLAFALTFMSIGIAVRRSSSKRPSRTSGRPWPWREAAAARPRTPAYIAITRVARAAVPGDGADLPGPVAGGRSRGRGARVAREADRATSVSSSGPGHDRCCSCTRRARSSTCHGSTALSTSSSTWPGSPGGSATGIYTIDAASWINLIHGRLDDAEALGREALEWASHGAEGFRSEALAAWPGSPWCGARSTRPSGSSRRRGRPRQHPRRAGRPHRRWPAWRGPGATSSGRRQILTDRTKGGAGRRGARPLGAGAHRGGRRPGRAGPGGRGARDGGRIRRLADLRVQLEPFARWAEGLVADDDEAAAAALAAAVAGFEAQGTAHRRRAVPDRAGRGRGAARPGCRADPPAGPRDARRVRRGPVPGRGRGRRRRPDGVVVPAPMADRLPAGRPKRSKDGPTRGQSGVRAGAPAGIACARSFVGGKGVRMHRAGRGAATSPRGSV